MTTYNVYQLKILEFLSINIILREGCLWQRYGKRHKKALGRTNKKTAEGVNMKLVSEYIPILICFVRFLSQYLDGS